jgi:CheY-like chemotaxis protein
MSDVLASLSDLRILIVEDEPLVALMLEDYVQEMGCRFALSATGTNPALEIIENMTPDFVILDVMMANGEPDFAIADDLAKRNIPFIFCSGHAPSIIAERHRRRPFLSKPFGNGELIAAFDKCGFSSAYASVHPSASCCAATASRTSS